MALQASIRVLKFDGEMQEVNEGNALGRAEENLERLETSCAAGSVSMVFHAASYIKGSNSFFYPLTSSKIVHT